MPVGRRSRRSTGDEATHREHAAATFGRVEGPFGAARLLGVNPHTLRSRMRKLGIDWTQYRAGHSQTMHDVG